MGGPEVREEVRGGEKTAVYPGNPYPQNRARLGWQLLCSASPFAKCPTGNFTSEGREYVPYWEERPSRPATLKSLQTSKLRRRVP